MKEFSGTILVTSTGENIDANRFIKEIDRSVKNLNKKLSKYNKVDVEVSITISDAPVVLEGK